MPVKSPEAVHLRLPSSSPLASVDAEMKVLREMWDKDVDYSGIAPLAAGLFRPVSELIPTENKQQITLRLDAIVFTCIRRNPTAGSRGIDSTIRGPSFN